MAVLEMDRRGLLKLIAGTGGLTLCCSRALFANGKEGDFPYRDDGMTVPLVEINPDNSAVIFNPNADMGQGTSTGIPLLIAEELDLDWETVTVEQMPLKRRRVNGELRHTYVWQGSGGSRSIVRGFNALSPLAAQGRDMFIRAAAKKWNVRASNLKTQDSHVLDPSSGRRFRYADLIDEVAALRPDTNVKIKKAADYRLFGKDTKITAGPNIVTGEPIFGIDQTYEGMVQAVIERCPHFHGSLKSLNDTAARAIDGVIDIIHIEQGQPGSPVAWQLMDSVAVVAETFWAAMKARELLEIEWNVGPFEGYSSADVENESLRLLDQDEGYTISVNDGMTRSEGDYDAAIAGATTVHDAKYSLAHVAHALMEPHSAIADIKSDHAYLHMPCQHPFRIQDLCHRMTGLDHESIKLDQSRSGGGFGRRWELDYPAEAIHLSMKLHRPVKVTWTREDELTQDRYRNANNYRMTGGVDANGRLVAMRQRQVSGYPTFDPSKEPVSEWYYEDLMGWHFEPGLVENHKMEQRFIPSPVPRGPWRAPGSVNSAFAQMSFLDELAHEAGIDPVEFNISVLGKPRTVKYSHHTGRMAECFRVAAEKAGWGRELPNGRGMGIAGCFSHASYVVHVVEVSVVDGVLTVEKVTTAADCGLAINPLSIRSQIEGCIMDGLSVALGQEITVENAAVQESNFDSYEMARMDRAPKQIEIHLIEGAQTPTGMGEPAMPPFAPALVNAIFAATGKRIRRLPIADQLEI